MNISFSPKELAMVLAVAVAFKIADFVKSNNSNLTSNGLTLNVNVCCCGDDDDGDGYTYTRIPDADTEGKLEKDLPETASQVTKAMRATKPASSEVIEEAATILHRRLQTTTLRRLLKLKQQCGRKDYLEAFINGEVKGSWFTDLKRFLESKGVKENMFPGNSIEPYWNDIFDKVLEMSNIV